MLGTNWKELNNSAEEQSLVKTKKRRKFGFLVSDSQSLGSGTSSEGS